MASTTPSESPLTLDRIVAAAEEAVRRFGPEKATVIDVARMLGVSHAAVYRHVATKAQLRDLVVRRWAEETVSPLRAIVANKGTASRRLRKFFDTLIATKRRRASKDPELFAAYKALAAQARPIIDAHVHELIGLAASIIRAGTEEGTFRAVNPETAARCILWATARFHHPAHCAEWTDPSIDATFDEIWTMLMNGLRAERRTK